MAIRAKRATYVLGFTKAGALQLRLAHASGQQVEMDRAAIVAALNPNGEVRATALENALLAIHAAGETAIKNALEAARTDLNTDPDVP